MHLAATSRRPALRQARQLVGVAAAVVLLDQLIKWYAWAYIDGTLINSGGYVLLGDTIRNWLADPHTGRIADVAGIVVIVVGACCVVRRPRHGSVLVGAALIAGGFVSNLADRFGMHHITAPGSPRGVVDFIPSGGTSRCNVADLLIVLGVVLQLVAVARRVRRSRQPR